MKKLYIFTIFILSGIVAYGLDGSGTYNDPYSGSITGTANWNSTTHSTDTVYIDGTITIGNNGDLTIGDGMFIKFVDSDIDLEITGTGKITANGTSSSKITFTADHDKDKIHGESGERWGHIIFDGMSGSNPSVFNHCIIEYGEKTGTTESYANAGGGICANYSYLTITDCTFRNNYALFGGGVFVAYGQNPTIERCYFKDNTVRQAGGGIYIYDNSSVEINNCIFEGNHANGITASYYSGGGIQMGKNTTNAKVINSTFVNNTSDRSGDGIYFYSSGQAINCIFWGSSDQITFRSSSGSVTNSAIQGFSSSSHFIDCFNLNTSNTAPDGPNFNTADWSINFISPCRDAGTTGAPSTDYDGNSRIGTPDIGAYEVQYSRWTGASGTGWSTSGSWENSITPSTGTGDIIIPKVTTNPSQSGTITIESDNNMIIEPGAQLTTTGLTNKGYIRLESDADDIFSVLIGSTGYAGSGTLIIELFLKGGPEPDNMWHYIAAPHAMDKSVITDIEPYNLIRYDDSKVSTSVNDGWHWHDGWDGSNTTSDKWTNLEVARGYNFYHSEDTTIEYSAFALYNSLGQVSLQNSSGGTDPNSLYGLNLLGNSLPCSIDWDLVTFSDDENVRNAIYMTTENRIASYVNGVGTNGGTRYIPPMQGFFVRTVNDSEYIDFQAAAKVHSTQPRFKGQTSVSLVRLEAANENGNTDEMVIRFNYNATDEFDSRYDASKILSKSLMYPQIYSFSGDEKYSINSLDYPETEREIPLGFKAMEQGDYTISATGINGVDNYDIYLTDKYEDNYTVDLKSVDVYSFTSEEGTFDDRFTLTIGGMATGVDDILQDNNEFNIYSSAGQLNIQNMSNKWNNTVADITVYDLTGRQVDKHTDNEMYTGETIQLPFNHRKGIFLIEISDGTRRSVQKLINR